MTGTEMPDPVGRTKSKVVDHPVLHLTSRRIQCPCGIMVN